MNYVKFPLKEGLNRRCTFDITRRGLPTVGRRAGKYQDFIRGDTRFICSTNSSFFIQHSVFDIS